jgi:hypothetical protein
VIFCYTARREDHMKLMSFGLTLAASALLSGCNRPVSTDPTPHGGRFNGIGIYSAGSMWARVGRTAPSDRSGAARTPDDEHVIVTVDNQTGEIRQCGDISGYCTGMNPWAAPLSATQRLPVQVRDPTTPPRDDAAGATAPAR